MMRRDRRHMVRLLIVGTAFLGWLACSDTGCDCLAPLEEPMAEEFKVYDAIQARITPVAVAFIEDNLAEILPAMLGEEGLVFEIPTSQQTFGIINVTICPTPCTLSAEVVDATLTMVPDQSLIQLDAVANVTGELQLDAGIVADCRVPVHMNNKQITANVFLHIDELDHLFYVTVTDFAVVVTEADFTLDCSGLFGWLVEALKDTITDMMNDEISSQLDGVINDMLNDLFCTPCSMYTTGCPAGSTCENDQFCMQDGVCRVKPLGMVGTLDLGEVLGEVGAGLQAELDIFAAVGQENTDLVDPVNGDPLLVANGLELRLIGGINTDLHICVPEPSPDQIPSTLPPVRLPLGDTIPGTGQSFMAGIGVSDVFLDWFIFQAYQSGLLCLALGTETTDMLNSATFALLGMPSLNVLTEGRVRPVKLKLKPTQPPVVEIGAGTFTEDAQGNQIIDEPLVYLNLDAVGLDFYVRIHERWTRVLSFSADLGIELALTVTPDNFLVPIIDQDRVTLENISVTNYELLSEDPEDLANLLPTLLEIAVPMIADMIGQIEIPPIDPFELKILAMQGEMPRTEDPLYYDYLGLYADLEIAQPKRFPRDTRVQIVELQVPPLERMSIQNHPPEYPKVIFEASSDAGEPAEFSWRLDNGLWSPYGRGPRFTVSDARLLLMGRHALQVRARTIGDYRTLDPSPATAEFDIQPPPRTETAGALVADRVVRHRQSEQAVTESTHGGGCSCSTRAPSWSLVLMLLGFIALRKTRRSRR